MFSMFSTLFLSVSYSGQVLPSFQRTTRVRFPSPMLTVCRSCRRRTKVSIPGSQPDNAGAIPVADSKVLFLSVSYSGQYSRLSNGQHGFDSRHRYFSGYSVLGSIREIADLIRVGPPSPVTARSWQSVLGTTTAHSCPCDGSIPSTATNEVAPRPQCLLGGELARREVSRLLARARHLTVAVLFSRAPP